MQIGGGGTEKGGRGKGAEWEMGERVGEGLWTRREREKGQRGRLGDGRETGRGWGQGENVRRGEGQSGKGAGDNERT